MQSGRTPTLSEWRDQDNEGNGKTSGLECPKPEVQECHAPVYDQSHSQREAACAPCEGIGSCTTCISKFRKQGFCLGVPQVRSESVLFKVPASVPAPFAK